MNTRLSLTSVQVVEQLQADARSAVPGSDSESIAEVAIDYCLRRPEREGETKLVAFDYHRNAKFAFYRSRERQRAAVAEYTRQNFQSVPAAPGVLDVADPSSVEEVVLERMSPISACVLEAASSSGEPAIRFVRSLMAGDSIAEAGRNAGVSRATAYRWRSEFARLIADRAA